MLLCGREKFSAPCVVCVEPGLLQRLRVIHWQRSVWCAACGLPCVVCHASSQCLPGMRCLLFYGTLCGTQRLGRNNLLLYAVRDCTHAVFGRQRQQWWSTGIAAGLIFSILSAAVHSAVSETQNLESHFLRFTRFPLGALDKVETPTQLPIRK